ncbi:MAG: exonuclease SbcCD subunit D [Candidatus Odinarchaeota archaeon]
MVIITITGDQHQNPRFGADVQEGYKQLRKKDSLNKADYLFETILDIRPNYAFFIGDYYDSPRPPPLRISDRLMKNSVKLMKEKIKAFWLKGNHDQTGEEINGYWSDEEKKGSEIDFLSPINSLRVAGRIFHLFTSIPETIQLEDGITVTGVSFNKKLEGKNIDPLESFKDKLDREVNGKFNILITHYYIEGFLPKSKEMEEPWIKRSSLDRFQLVLSGHIHSYKTSPGLKKIIGGNQFPIIIYPGSLYKQSFNEENTTKGFVKIEIIDGKIKDLKLIEIPDRPFRTIEINIPNGHEKPLEFIKNTIDEQLKVVDRQDLVKQILRLKLRGTVDYFRTPFTHDEIRKYCKDRTKFTKIEDSISPEEPDIDREREVQDVESTLHNRFEEQIDKQERPEDEEFWSRTAEYFFTHLEDMKLRRYETRKERRK